MKRFNPAGEKGTECFSLEKRISIAGKENSKTINKKSDSILAVLISS
jgi:hypothetical protein